MSCTDVGTPRDLGTLYNCIQILRAIAFDQAGLGAGKNTRRTLAPQLSSPISDHLVMVPTKSIHSQERLYSADSCVSVGYRDRRTHCHPCHQPAPKPHLKPA